MARRSRARWIVPFLIACALGRAAVAPPGAAAAAGRAAEGGVVIYATSATARGVGAGTVVAVEGSRVDVLTAKHVATYGALAIALEDGALVSARIAALVPGRDLAIVEADLAPQEAADLRPAAIAPPASRRPVHVWGSGTTGPALESGVVGAVGATMPDGTAPAGRYELACRLCHRGDSGAGVFDAAGRLVGVYVGYFLVERGTRVQIAEMAPTAGELATATAPKIAMLGATP